MSLLCYYRLYCLHLTQIYCIVYCLYGLHVPQLNPAETKRLGKPHMHRVKKSVTGSREGGSGKRDLKWVV